MLCSVIIVKMQKVHQTGQMKSVQYHITTKHQFLSEEKVWQ